MTLRLSLLVAALALAAPSAALAQAARPAASRLTKAPKLVTFVEAPFPESERATSPGATVTLQVAISAAGTVDAVAVQESAGPAFDAAALDAVRRFVFEPAEIDGRVAPVKILYRYAFVLREAHVTTAELAGEVRDRQSKQPLAGVRVELDTGQTATTDATGRFVFTGVAPGRRGVSFSREGVTPVRSEETLVEGKRATVRYDLDVKPANAPKAADEDDFEVVVVAPPLEKQVVSVEVSAEQGRRVPGAQGDVLKVVESMPGVARSSVGSGALVVWGAAPQDTRVYVDGVRLPVLYHNGGLRSVIHSDMVQSVELIPGGFGAAYGRGLGGLVTVGLKPLEGTGFHGSASADLIDASLSARVALTDRLRLAVSGRRSHLDRVLARVTDRDIGEVVPIPRYHDGQARLTYDLGPRETLEIGGLLSHDDIDRTVLGADPADVRRESRQVGFTRAFVRYGKAWEDGSSVSLVPWVGTETSRTATLFGSTPTSLAVDSTSYGLRAGWRGRLGKLVTASVGLDGEVMASRLARSGSVTQPAREGDLRVFGQPPSAQINADRWTTTQASLAPYGELDVSLFHDTLHIVPGVRLDALALHGSRSTPATGDTPPLSVTGESMPVEPRLAIHYTPVPRITAKAAYGVYHQAPLPEELSAVFGNPQLGVAHARHLLAAGAFRLTDRLSAEVTVFHSSSGDLVVRNPSASPLLAQALQQGGVGRAFGAQFLLRQQLARGFFGWVSFTMLRSERALDESSPWRRFDYDQTHVLTALASYDLGRGWEVGARFRYATGFPRTPVVGAYYDARRDLSQPVFGPINSERIPAFYQLDARLAKRWTYTSGDAEVYLDVQNVTNRANPEEFVYRYDYRERRTITGLPTLPVLGAKVTW